MTWRAISPLTPLCQWLHLHALIILGLQCSLRREAELPVEGQDGVPKVHSQQIPEARSPQNPKNHSLQVPDYLVNGLYDPEGTFNTHLRCDSLQEVQSPGQGPVQGSAQGPNQGPAQGTAQGPAQEKKGLAPPPGHLQLRNKNKEYKKAPGMQQACTSIVLLKTVSKIESPKGFQQTLM